MPEIKIPASLKAFFRKEGIDDLPTILQLLATVSPVIVINTQDFPVQTFPGGKLRIVTEEVTNSDTGVSVDLRPPPGKKWRILVASGSHNDSTARDAYWQFYDGITPIGLGSSSLAQFAPLFLINTDAAVGRTLSPVITLSNDVYAQFLCAFATAETYKATIVGLVLEVDV